MQITLEELVALALSTVRHVVRRVMEVDAGSEEAATLVRSAHDVVAQLLGATNGDEQSRDLDAATAQLLGSLRQQDGGNLPALGAPTDDEIELQARHAATVMMASWSEFLRRALRKPTGLVLELDGGFLLPRRPREVPQRLRERLFETLEPLGFDRDDAGEIMCAVSRQLFERSRLVQLPSGVELSLRDDGVVLARLPS